jgi:hypothetical protein
MDSFSPRTDRRASVTELSPAAAAIVAAFDLRYELLGPLEGNWQEVCLAAALRALADHQTPVWDGTGPAAHPTGAAQLRRRAGADQPMTARSRCCGAPVQVAGNGTTHWYRCSCCGQPTDIAPTVASTPGPVTDPPPSAT